MGARRMTSTRIATLLVLVLCVLCSVSADRADDRYNDAPASSKEDDFAKAHDEMTQKLRKKHGLPDEKPVDRGRGRRDDDHDSRMDEAMRRMRDMPGMDDRRDRRDRYDRYDRDRMDRMDRYGHDDDRRGYRGSRSRRYDDEEEEMSRMAEEDHHIGKTREVTFTEAGGLGMHISREWGHSHFLVDKVAGQAQKKGVKVGEVIAAVNGKKVRWKNLQQLTDMIKRAGRPVTVTVGEHR